MLLRCQKSHTSNTSAIPNMDETTSEISLKIQKKENRFIVNSTESQRMECINGKKRLENRCYSNLKIYIAMRRHVQLTFSHRFVFLMGHIE